VSEPVKCYAVTSGEYSAYTVHAIYRRREDAEVRVERSRLAPKWIVDGDLATSDREDLPTMTTEYPQGSRTIVDWDRVKDHPDRLGEFDDARVEEFDYFEGDTPGGARPTDV
jgi:hypothetical protein